MSSVAVGTRLGRYEIRSQIGAGGMGEVYLAQDTKLDRKVALKILPAEVAADCHRMNRFVQEAKAASALNHPNIITIYEIEQADSVNFIATEFIDGETLRQRMRSEPVKLGEVLDVAVQIASALSAAHAAGIVHRDLKPENVMLRRDGIVKVLDFGLAKLTQRRASGAIDTEAPTKALLNTEPGLLLGTAQYMSPEQARGLGVDARTDIWSLGCVLYEMVAGRQPFVGATNLDVLSAILNREPDLLGHHIPEAPQELEHIVSKALRKDVEERYQTVKDLLIDLKDLKRDLEVHAQLERTASPELRGRAPTTLSSKPAIADSVPTAALPTGADAKARTTSSAEYVFSQIKRHQRLTAITIAALVITAAALSYFLYLKPRHASALTEQDTIVLADFINTTGDPVFDATLRQGLAIQLEQSPFLSLISDQRIQQTLRLMGQTADARLTPDLAREICERTASAAVLEGSIASLGSEYVLGLRAKNCRTGDVLDEEQVQAARKEDVLNTLSQIASKFRTRVGESLATVQRHDTPLAEATTPSLEALKAYSAARKAFYSGGSSGAVPLLQRALEIDPKFAMAYAFLGDMYENLGESALSAENTRKGYELRDRASDHERFFINLSYDRLVTGNLERAQQTGELWAQTYPRDPDAHAILSGLIYEELGKYERSIEEGKIAIGLDPDLTPGYANLAYTYVYLDRLEEADKTLRQASERKLEYPDLLLLRYEIAFFKGDKVGMEQASSLGEGKPGTEDWIADEQAFTLAYSGHLQQARTISRRAMDVAQQAAQKDRAAMYATGAAVWEAFFGNAAEARRRAMAALELSKGRDVEYGAAFALVLSGESSRSQTLANDLERRFPEDTCVRSTYVPTLRALVALNSGEPRRAVEQLQTAVPYDLALPGSWFGFFGSIYPAYARGEAYLAAHQNADAAAEFQKILDHRGLVFNDPVGVVARLQLGRAFALAGDTTKAKTAYQDFLTLWKDADPDIPILVEARKEYEKLK